MRTLSIDTTQHLSQQQVTSLLTLSLKFPELQFWLEPDAYKENAA